MMKKGLTEKEFKEIEKKMNDILALATERGGFEHLTVKENDDLQKYTKAVQAYEEVHHSIQ